MTAVGAAKSRRTAELRRKVDAETEAKESEHPLDTQQKTVEKKDNDEIDKKLTAAEFLAMQAYFTTGSGTKLEKLQEHSKLFFAFSSFLRSGIEE